MVSQVHVATFKMVMINSLGAVVPETASMSETLQATKELRVNVDPSISNTAGYPTLAAYLALEAADSFVLQHLDQTYIITYK